MKKRLYIFIALILIFVYCFPTDSVAEYIDDLREKRKDAQDKIAENTLQIDELEIQISDLMAQIQELNEDIYRREVAVAVLEEEISELNEKIYNIEKVFYELETQYNKRKKLLAERVIAQYEAGDIVYLDFLLNSNGLIEFISNFYMLDEILTYDEDILKDYERQKEQVEKVKNELDIYRQELKERKSEQKKETIVLENKKVIKNSQMATLSQEERELQQEIDEYQNEVKEIEIEILMLLTANLDSDYVGGALAWPVPGYMTITSNYGMRVHPIYGVYRMHAGTDIGAPMGAFMIAVNDGVVVTSRYSASYGNVVVIDHGGGLSTLYAHGTERLVEAGDEVKRGQPVLTVGSTGVSTGPHAHFEVRVNGICVNPLEYILKNNSEELTEEEETNEQN